MSHEEYMMKAVVCAKASEARGGVAIGAIVVDVTGKIVGSGMSLTAVIHDVTHHAEMAAIREACEKMQTINLEGCVLYGTLESCGMCVSAALWANMDTLYFGAYASDALDNRYEFKNYNSKERVVSSQKWNGQPINVIGGILRQECTSLLAGYKDWQRTVR